MNRSPGCAWRESVHTRVIVAAGEPLSSSPPQPSATYFKERASTSLHRKAGRVASVVAPPTQSFQGLARVNPVIERNDSVLKLLVGFVAFARNQDRVARIGRSQDLVDGPTPIQFDPIAVATRGAKTRFHLRRDFLRRLAARIVAGDDREISQCGRHFPHLRPLAGVA